MIYCLLGKSAPVQALELKTEEFFFCQKKTAVSISARTVRVHYFPEQGRCFVIQSVQGRDTITARGKWQAFCRKRAKEIKDKWQKNLWSCEKQAGGEVFYPASFQPNSELKTDEPFRPKTQESL